MCLDFQLFLLKILVYIKSFRDYLALVSSSAPGSLNLLSHILLSEMTVELNNLNGVGEYTVFLKSALNL